MNDHDPENLGNDDCLEGAILGVELSSSLS